MVLTYSGIYLLTHEDELSIFVAVHLFNEVKDEVVTKVSLQYFEPFSLC